MLRLTCEHALAKRISSDIYIPLEGRRGTSPSKNGDLTNGKRQGNKNESIVLMSAMFP